MKKCTHSNEKTSIVSRNMTSTVYQRECKDCGQIVYVTESTKIRSVTHTFTMTRDARRR